MIGSTNSSTVSSTGGTDADLTIHLEDACVAKTRDCIEFQSTEWTCTAQACRHQERKQKVEDGRFEVVKQKKNERKARARSNLEDGGKRSRFGSTLKGKAKSSTGCCYSLKEKRYRCAVGLPGPSVHRGDEQR